jgi:hypothetical protein
LEKLHQLKALLTERAAGKPDIKSQLMDAINKVTLIYILAENGGVMLNDYYCFTQTFDWLK